MWLCHSVGRFVFLLKTRLLQFLFLMSLSHYTGYRLTWLLVTIIWAFMTRVMYFDFLPNRLYKFLVISTVTKIWKIWPVKRGYPYQLKVVVVNHTDRSKAIVMILLLKLLICLFISKIVFRYNGYVIYLGKKRFLFIFIFRAFYHYGLAEVFAKVLLYHRRSWIYF